MLDDSHLLVRERLVRLFSFYPCFTSQRDAEILWIDAWCAGAYHSALLYLHLPEPDGKLFRFGGEVRLARTEEEVDAAVQKLGSPPVVGFDMEWHAPCVKNVPPSRTALIQICSSAAYCAVFALGDFDEMPSSLRTFLWDRDILKVNRK